MSRDAKRSPNIAMVKGQGLVGVVRTGWKAVIPLMLIAH